MTRSEWLVVLITVAGLAVLRDRGPRACTGVTCSPPSRVAGLELDHQSDAEAPCEPALPGAASPTDPPGLRKVPRGR